MAKKMEKCKKRYIDGEGEEFAHAFEDTVALRFKFANPDANMVNVSPDDFPENVKRCLTYFGISEKLGNAYAGSESADEAYDMFTALYERLASGEWIAEKIARGPRIGLIVEAVLRYAKEEGKEVGEGKEVDPNIVAEKYKGNKELRDKALENPHVNRHFEAIKFEKQQERLKAAEELALKAGVDAEESGEEPALVDELL